MNLPPSLKSLGITIGSVVITAAIFLIPSHFLKPLPPSDALSITGLEGGSVPEHWPVGKALGLAVSGAASKTATWEIEPPSVFDDAMSVNNGAGLIIEPGAAPVVVNVRVYGSKSGRVVIARKTIAFDGATPTPGPTPGPTPVPPPGPDPIPPSPEPDPSSIFPDIRAAIAVRSRVERQVYGDAAPKIAATAATYNDIGVDIVTKMKESGTAVGKAIDAAMAPFFDDNTVFKDKAAAQAAFKKVEASILAGQRDALKSP